METREPSKARLRQSRNGVEGSSVPVSFVSRLACAVFVPRVLSLSFWLPSPVVTRQDTAFKSVGSDL